MTILTYVVSFGLFSITAWVVPTLVFWGVDQLTESIDLKSHLIAAGLLFATCGFCLLMLTNYIWHGLGFQLGWLFPAIVAASHFLWARAPEASQMNKAQGYGIVCGVIAFGLFSIFG